jgi:hypothetical protein
MKLNSPYNSLQLPLTNEVKKPNDNNDNDNNNNNKNKNSNHNFNWKSQSKPDQSLSEQQANSHNIIATMNGQRTGHLVFFSLSFRHTVVHSLSNPHSLQAL